MSRAVLRSLLQRPCCLERSTGVERWRAMTVIRGLHDGVVPLVEGNQASDTRVICERDVKLFGYISGDLNPIHFKGLPSKDGTTNHIVVHGAYLNALVSGVIGSKLPGPGTVVIAQNLRFPRPCIVGDTVTTTVQVNTVRKIVEVTFQCVVDVASENPKIVLEGSAKLIIPATMGSSSN